MCGIAGFVDFARDKSAQSLKKELVGMTNAIRHRGPDDSGEFFEPSLGIALGHRRLSIIDLSLAGHQPMESTCERYVIIYNGEIYNFIEIKAELEHARMAPKWRGHSDTEVMLAAISAWGIDAALPRMNGMFAFVLYDRKLRCLHLIRDRVGEKPLYFGWKNDCFVFGSELKALCAYQDWSPGIDRNVLALYLRHNYVPAPYCIYSGIRKVSSGTYVTLPFDKGSNFELSETQYWSARDIAEQGSKEPLDVTENEAVSSLDSMLRKAVKLRMVADVPLGAFLSGGIDSSIILAMMQAQSERKVKSFCIGFHDDKFNEAHHASVVASHLGTDHTELYITPSYARNVIPNLPDIYDEPFGDSSQIPTFLLSQMAGRHVKVALSGDGGDELFGGYPRYFLTQKRWNAIRWMPPKFCKSSSQGLGIMQKFLEASAPFVPFGQSKIEGVSRKLNALSWIMNGELPQSLYLYSISQSKHPEQLIPGSTEPLSALTDPNRQANLAGFFEQMMTWDFLSYLPDDILVKVDRAAMAVSLETRIPLLDPNVIKFAGSLPLHMRQRGGQGKWLLRQVLYKYVPKVLIDRPKMGFGVPVGDWIKGPLLDWAESLLDQDVLNKQGFFNSQQVRDIWQNHKCGRQDKSGQLWTILMFQAWLMQRAIR